MLIDIMFDDLKPEVQAEILELMGLSSADEMNWATVPLFQMETDLED